MGPNGASVLLTFISPVPLGCVVGPASLPSGNKLNFKLTIYSQQKGSLQSKILLVILILAYRYSERLAESNFKFVVVLFVCKGSVPNL